MSIAITCGSPPAGKVGTAYSHTFPVTGAAPPNTFTLTAGSLPPGLSLIAATGQLSGVPSAAGSYAFTIQVTDTVGSSSVACTILVNLNVSCNNPPGGSIGAPYTHTLSTAGGTAPYTYTLATSGTLPPGLTLDGATVLSFPAGARTLGPVIPPPRPTTTLVWPPLPVTNGWATTLDAGSDLPHALIYAGDSLWIGCETNPGRVCRINPLNPAVVTTLILPDDGRHSSILDMAYIPAKGKIYALCADPFESTIGTVIEIDPVTGAYTDVIITAYSPGQGAIAFDANYLYVASWNTRNIYRYSLTGFGFVSSLTTILQNPHAMDYDPVSGFLFCTSAANIGTTFIAQINVGTFTIVGYGTLTTDIQMTDDIAFAGGYVWCGSEDTGNIVKFLAADVTAPAIHITTGVVAARDISVYYDGGVIWSGWEGGLGVFGRINVTTNAVELFRLPNGGVQASPNEFVRHGPNLYMTNWTSPGQVCQVTVTDWDPVVVPAGIISGTPTTGGTYVFTVHVVDASGNTGDASCSITIASGIGCNNPPTGSIGLFYTHSITVAPSGAVASITGGALPPGLTMSAAGVITGTPTLAGNYTFTITVTAV